MPINMKTVILDASFILHALQYKIDIITELHKLLDTNFTPIIIDKTTQELKGKKLGNLAVTYLASHHVAAIPTTQERNVDNLILSNLTQETLVATQDKKLKEKLKKRKTGIITIRQKRYLALV